MTLPGVRYWSGRRQEHHEEQYPEVNVYKNTTAEQPRRCFSLESRGVLRCNLRISIRCAGILDASMYMYSAEL